MRFGSIASTFQWERKRAPGRPDFRLRAVRQTIPKYLLERFICTPKRVPLHAEAFEGECRSEFYSALISPITNKALSLPALINASDEMTLQDDEHNLIAELKRGSKEAFDRIYRLYAGRLLAYCVQYTKCREDAEEIVQDVFVALWNNRETIRQEETLCSLLFTISKHRVINAWRATLNSPVYEDYIDYQDQLSGGEDYHRLEYEQYVKIVKEAIHRLPPTQQHVITLSRFSQLSNKEIAEHLSLSEQTVKNQLSVGLKTLRELLSKVLTMSLAGLILNIVNKWL